MWWERWIPKSYVIKSEICGVECLREEDTNTFYYTFLQNKKNKIEITKRGTSSNSSEILSLTKKSSIPIVLAINGKGVISKKIIFSENDSLQLQDLIKQHFSTILVHEFYVQFYQNSNNSGHLVICRKKQVDDIIQQFETKKLEVVNVFLGSLICNSISNLTATFNRIDTSINQLQLVNGEVDTIQSYHNEERTNLTIGDLNLTPNEIIAFSSGFSYLTQQRNYITENIEISQLSIKHSEKIKVKLLIFSMVIFLFVICVANAFIFSQKFVEDNALEVQLNMYESKNSQITQLLENYQKKKSLIEQTGIFENKKLSVYADKIALSLPEDILLRDLYFNPQTEETEEDSLVSFNSNELIIKGNCTKSLLLNEWVNVLKSQSYVKSVNLESFIFNSEGHLPNFILKVETK
jgi:hypothetical protein